MCPSREAFQEFRDAEWFQELLTRHGLPVVFSPVIVAVVGRLGWHCYVAETAGREPIGVGAMFVDGDTAWLGLGATVPAARRMGRRERCCGRGSRRRETSGAR